MIPLKELYTLLPPKQLERLAATYELDSRNQVKLSGPVVFLCLLNGLLNHNELTQRLLAQTYQRQTGVPVSQSSISKGLARIPSAYFADLFAWLRTRIAPKLPAHAPPGGPIRFVDATTVTLSAKLLDLGLLVGTCSPDKARRHVKSVVELAADGLPNFLHLCTEPSENADSVALGETMRKHSQPGDLWVFDKGCHGRERLLALQEAQAFFLTPQSQQHVQVSRVLFTTDPASGPEGVAPPGAPRFHLRQVEVGVFGNSQTSQKTREKWEGLPLVLIHGRRYDARSQSWKPLTLLTNLPLSEDGKRAGPYTFEELADVYRLRGEIEVLFKFLKQHLSYSHLTSRCENGIRVMIYTSLMAGLLLIWYRQKSGNNQGWRAVKFWLAENVRQWTERAVRASRLVPG